MTKQEPKSECCGADVAYDWWRDEYMCLNPECMEYPCKIKPCKVKEERDEKTNL